MVDFSPPCEYLKTLCAFGVSTNVLVRAHHLCPKVFLGTGESPDEYERRSRFGEAMLVKLPRPAEAT